MTLDLTSLRRAIIQLEEALELCASDIATANPIYARHFRAAAIQAFEFTYELSFKLLQRTLQATQGDPLLVKRMSFDDVVRLGYDQGLLNGEVNVWREFRKNRGTTSHTYDEVKAEEVFAVLPEFAEEARFLLERLTNGQLQAP